MSERLFYSVIIPAHNAAGMLPRSLGALRNSDLSRDHWELIVVDDGSSDETSLIAARYADTVVTLPGKPNGPAYARNRGFEVSRGDVIIFIDADSVAHVDTLSRFAALFETQPDLGAAFGSYDDRPPAPGIMSQYRNLIHHHVHHMNAGDVETFWAGTGAIRRDVFAEAGMYDEWHYARPQIEDIELGGRIRRLGRRIVLDPAIQGTHLKRWTLGGVIRTDLRDRGIPWARLLMHRGAMMSSGTLNLRWTEKLNTILVWAAVFLAIAAPIARSLRPLGLAAACIAIVLLMNIPLWLFFARVRGPIFAALVMPAHLMYYLLNGISFGVGLLLQHLIGPPLPDPTMSAYAEVGVKRWPPFHEEPAEFMDRWRSVTFRRGGRLAYRPHTDVIRPGSQIMVTPEESPVIPAMLFAFAPLHKRAFGVATGVAGAVLMALLTAAGILLPGAPEFPLDLLAQYFQGYSVTWPGVLIGAVWGFGVSFVAGWFAAFCRNLALAISAFMIRTRAELDSTREFLDHI